MKLLYIAIPLILYFALSKLGDWVKARREKKKILLSEMRMEKPPLAPPRKDKWGRPTTQPNRDSDIGF